MRFRAEVGPLHPNKCVAGERRCNFTLLGEILWESLIQTGFSSYFE
jgi:hypothetical protein